VERVVTEKAAYQPHADHLYPLDRPGRYADLKARVPGLPPLRQQSDYAWFWSLVTRPFGKRTKPDEGLE
jgi:hypothetical protein